MKITCPSCNTESKPKLTLAHEDYINMTLECGHVLVYSFVAIDYNKSKSE